MKKSLITLTTIMILSASMSISTFAMTAEEVTAKTPTSYTAGTNSVYGSKLTQEQLNAVAQTTADFMTANITEGMDTDQKIKAAYDYIKNRTTYVNWDAVTGANTAYTLVTGQGACSGMCRSMKALCDAMGIECYHVHSTSNDHQWNLIRYGDGILYHVDIDANKSAGQDIIYKSLTHPLPYDTSAYPAVGQAQAQGQEQTQPTTPQPTDGQHTRTFNDTDCWIVDDTEPLQTCYDTNGNKYYVISESTTSIRYLSDKSNLDPSKIRVIFSALKYNPDTNTINVFSSDGTAIYEDFRYDETYELKIPNVDLKGSDLVNYCKQNNIMIRIDVNDKDDVYGARFLYCYK